MGCCGNKQPKLDYLIKYRDGTTEQVPASEGIMEVRRRIQAHPSGGGTIGMVPPKK